MENQDSELNSSKKPEDKYSKIFSDPLFKYGYIVSMSVWVFWVFMAWWNIDLSPVLEFPITILVYKTISSTYDSIVNYEDYTESIAKSEKFRDDIDNIDKLT